MGRTLGKADLHIHTRHGDGMATVAELLAYVERLGDLDVVAVTEHDTFRAGDEARELHARGSYSFDVIAGEEVTTLDGHLLALFIDRPVPSFRRMEETLEEVHRQGGLAVVPHPLSRLTRSVTPRVFDRIESVRDEAVRFDAVEECSLSPASRFTTGSVVRLNRDKLRLPAVGASDAHFLPSIASAYTEFEGRTSADLRHAVESGATSAVRGRSPRLSELGYRNIAVQQWRGISATPRSMGWGPTVRSFFSSRMRIRAARVAEAPVPPEDAGT